MPSKPSAQQLQQPISPKENTKASRSIGRKLTSILGLGAALLTASCVQPIPPVQPVQPEQPVKKPAEQTDTYQNPHPKGTYAYFKARKDYRKTSETYKNYALLETTNAQNSSIVISLADQRAQLMNGNEVAMDYAVSTGTSKYPTPAGSYKVREMIKEKRSNQYGKILDASGDVVKSNATMPKDKKLIPEGGKYLGASMPYWMRLTWSGIGMHVGNVPRYPASHACIRGQSSVMPIIFSKVKILTPVTIVD